jgi:hypothetical protein
MAWAVCWLSLGAVAVPFQDVEDLEDEAPGHAGVVGHARVLLSGRRAGGRMSGAMPVPVAGFQPCRGW